MARLFNSCIIFVLLITISGCVPDIPDDGDPMESPDTKKQVMNARHQAEQLRTNQYDCLKIQSGEASSPSTRKG